MTVDEMIDVLNEDGEVINTIPRRLAEQGNHTTQNVLVFVFNSRGEVWAQLRPQNKKHYPGKWDISACGGVISGEPRDEAARRESLEEMGIQVELHHVESFMNIFPGDSGETRRRLSHLYIGKSDETPRANAEVDEFRIWQVKELRKHATRYPGAYVPSFLSELDKALSGYRRFE